MASKNDLSALKAGQGSASILPTSRENTAANAPANDKPKAPKKSVKRLNKGFQVEAGRAVKWDLFVARMKAEGKTGPVLIDEALDLVFSKYKAE